MSAGVATNRMLVELDALLDTRYALFRRFDQAKASKLLRSGSYQARFTDHFWEHSDLFTKEDWDKAWSERDMSLLKESFLTSAIDDLKDAIANINWGLRETDPKKIIVTLNVAPYNLPPAVVDAYKAVLEAELFMVDEVEVTSIPLWIMHPEQISERYDLVMMYNFHEWLAMFEHRFEEFEMGATLLIVPRLFKELPPRGSKEWKELEAMDVFLFAEMRFFSRCELRFLTPSSFSLPRDFVLK